MAEKADDGEQGWTGFSTQLTPDQLQAALSGWWRCDPERVVRAGLMAVTLGQYVVAVLTGIDGYDGRGDGRYRFHGTLAGSVTELVTPQQWVNPDAPGADRARLLLGRRLESESGGPVAYGARPVSSCTGRAAACAEQGRSRAATLRKRDPTASCLAVSRSMRPPSWSSSTATGR
ncbi:hypothetical protein [Streptomyces albidoflavus]|uniref:hypothetical protein n=1 Tax=Streptomyces albidoflavus TaxID=1886 RepID=UPI0020D2403D|nr:hypothetical protein [Streptomyces albidoflavus]